MRTVLAAFAALMLLPGCLDGGKEGDDRGDIGPAGTAWDFTSALVGLGGDAETSVLVGPDGLILACSHGGFGQPSPSWVSEDFGATWRRLDPQPNPIVSGDCDWAVLEDGTWALVYDTIASSTVAVTSDRGDTWALNYASALPFGGVDRPWLAADGNVLYMAYANVMAAEPAINTLAISRDGGRTWLDHSIAHTASTEQMDRPNTVIGHPLVLDGVIRIPLASTDFNAGGPTWLSFAVSRDDGGSWVEEMVAGPYPAFFHLPAAAQAADGTLFVTKSEGDVSGQSLDVLVSRDDGQTWNAVHVADDVAYPSVSGPWIDVRPDGSLTIAWMQQTEEGRSVWAGRLDADGLLVPARQLTDPVADESVYEFLMLDHDADGRAVIVYPMDTGDCTLTTPLAPGRSQQCVYALIEDA